jgi:hypothetical protein
MAAAWTLPQHAVPMVMAPVPSASTVALINTAVAAMMRTPATRRTGNAVPEAATEVEEQGEAELRPHRRR